MGSDRPTLPQQKPLGQIELHPGLLRVAIEGTGLHSKIPEQIILKHGGTESTES
jgi:hypothetical protein